MPKGKRALLGLGIAVILVGVYGWLFGFQTVSALVVRYEYRKIPDTAKTPVALADLSISTLPHKKVTYFGYEFELPWDDVEFLGLDNKLSSRAYFAITPNFPL